MNGLRLDLGRLALARGELDRASVRRSDTGWVEAAWSAPDSQVLVLAGDRAPVRLGEEGAALVMTAPAQAPEGVRLLLGVDAAGAAYFAVAAPPDTDLAALGLVDQDASDSGGTQVTAAALRSAGPLLSDRDAGIFTHAVALANWHASHTHCPRCGAPTEPVAAGHLRVCTADGTEHFPRVDPAVITLVTDEADRCLLARNRRWPPRRVSILAGFVEPGESAEQAVVREVAEETGVGVRDVRYLGSQPWPMPQSLMLGFRARAADGQVIAVDDEEISEADWYSRDDVRGLVASGGLLLPPPVSIAHQIIEAWYGGPLPGAW